MNSDTTPLHDQINRLQSALRAAREELSRLISVADVAEIGKADQTLYQIDAALAVEVEAVWREAIEADLTADDSHDIKQAHRRHGCRGTEPQS